MGSFRVVGPKSIRRIGVSREPSWKREIAIRAEVAPNRDFGQEASTTARSRRAFDLDGPSSEKSL